jgi:hypothetical protein
MTGWLCRRAWAPRGRHELSCSPASSIVPCVIGQALLLGSKSWDLGTRVTFPAMTTNAEKSGAEIGEPITETSTSTPDLDSTQEQFEQGKKEGEESIWRRVYTFLTWTPPNCRWDPKKPPQFSMSMSMHISVPSSECLSETNVR